MKKLILGALICLYGMASHANDAPMSAPDKALLSNISQAHYVAVIYTVNECGFQPGAAIAVTLLMSPALADITAALARPNGPAPALDSKACAALAKN